MPFSPWIGSSTTAATSSLVAAARALRIPVRNEDHLSRQRNERLAVLRVVGQRQGAHGTTMKRALSRDDLGAPGHPSDLEAPSLASVPELVKNTRPSSAPVIVVRARGECNLGRSGEEVGDVSEGGDLSSDRGEHCRVSVAKGIDRDAGQQVEYRRPSASQT